MKKYTPKTVDFFIKRIGKRVYRDKTECQCIACIYVCKNGLAIIDENHAEYLAMIDSELASYNVHLNYRDNKKTWN